MDGWKEGKAGLRIAYSNQKSLVTGRVEGWKDGRMEAKAGLRIAYSNQKAWLRIAYSNQKTWLLHRSVNE